MVWCVFYVHVYVYIHLCTELTYNGTIIVSRVEKDTCLEYYNYDRSGSIIYRLFYEEVLKLYTVYTSVT